MNLLQQLINGIVLGHAYALIAIGGTLLLCVAQNDAVDELLQ
ncbi:hypothetical protein [Klebsiella pneumoniae]|nr:hypothetical protein [Klebsiella pneumoniae]